MSFVATIQGALDLAVLILCSALRMGSSSFVAGNLAACKRPTQPLIIYEFQGCPFCRKVKEAASVLGLEVLYYPTPKVGSNVLAQGKTAGSRYRGEAKQLGGKVQFPFLIDRDQGVQMYESDAIVDYLWRMYGDKATQPVTYWLATSFLLQWTIFFTSGLRVAHGMKIHPSKLPKDFQPVTLWGYDGSPFVNRVVEKLVEMEIPHIYKHCPHSEGPHRKEFIRRFGHLLSPQRKLVGAIQVPLLEDPNTETVMLESSDICNYLEITYGI